MYFHFRTFFEAFEFFYHIAYPFGFFCVMFSWLPHFSPKLFVHSVVGMFSCYLSSFLGRIFFRCFGMSCFVCFVLLFVDISLILLLSLVLFGLFFLALPFLICLYMFQRLSFVLSFWPVFVDFSSAFPVEFPILVLIFSSCFLRGSQFSHKLISPRHRLAHIIRLYYLLMYKLVLDLFFPFLS